ncbi:eukaryotic translation initiation factor 3 subunit J [Copromyces sp. CBS 386.78]|nr:eukaryotic translation initiation factor 3 subunit J [Copromyces sp. CBS 386.78]
MPGKKWDEEESESSAPNSPVLAPGRRRFDDEEGNESDVLDSWDAAEDSEVEREKAKKAAEAKAKADEEAAANKKSKAQRIAERQAERARQLAEDSDAEEETEAERRERLRREQKESDLKHAEDLFAGIGISNDRKVVSKGTIVQIDPKDPNNTIDISTLALFNPTTKAQFETLRTTLGPMIEKLSPKPQYVLFLQEFAKGLAKDLKSDEIKKIASTLTALSNEKLKEEKAAEKGGKKSKAAKTKTSLAGVGRGGAMAEAHDTYEDDGFGDDDFM